MKKILFTIIIALFVLPIFAGGANEGRLYYLPRNVVNNSNVMIEVGTAKSLQSISDTYSNTSDDNLALFRLRNSLKSDDQPSGSTVTITISSSNGWYFVNENNPTSKTPFELSCCITDRKRDSNRSYDNQKSQTWVNGTVTLPTSSMSCSFVKNGSNYELTMPETTFDRVLASYYSKYIREADICVVIPNTDTTLEPGYYETTLTITSTSYQEHQATEGFVPRITQDGGVKTLTETIHIRGYVGLDPSFGEGDYSFSINSASDTYSMDLGIYSQSNPYDVANVYFSYTQLVSSSPNTTTQKSKFTLYISPTRVYSVDGSYNFIKMNSENQARTSSNTIGYELYVKTSGGYTKLSDCTSSTSYSDGDISSVSTYSGTHTYALVPSYTSEQISSAGLLGGSNQWKENWILDQEIYLKLTSDSLSSSRDMGLYYSYIYLTLVAN